MLIQRPLPRKLSARAASHLKAFRSEMEAVLPGKIDQVVLFGSRARGTAHRQSDYDVAVFVRDLDEPRLTQRLATTAAFPHLVAGIHIVPITLPHDYLATNEPTALAVNIAREGVAIA